GAAYRATVTYDVDEATIEEPGGEEPVSRARPYTGNGLVTDAGPVVAEAVVGQPVTAAPTPDVSVEPTTGRGRHTRGGVIAAPAADGPDGLPRRVRQRSLAPQLRDAPPADDAAVAGPSTTRSPEELRAMMSSFQAGMNRGRRDADDAAEAASGPADALFP